MIKVLIADDEPKIRAGLARCIPWEEYEMNVCALAFDGEDALEKAEEYHPDICLVDICMPILSGLEFIEKIHEIYRDVICIVITGYDEFAYAQKAVKIGVFEYILKPVNEEELLKTVLRAKKEIEDRRTNQEKEKQTEELLTQSFPILKEQFLIQLLKTNMTVDEIKKQQILYNIEKSKKMYLFFIPCRALNCPVKSMVEELAGNLGKADTFWDDERNMILLLRMETEHLPDTFVENLEKNLEALRGYPISVKYETLHELAEIPYIYSKWKEEKEEYSSELMKKIRKYVEHHFSNAELSVQMLGDIFHVNTSYLSRTFKQEMGINLAEYITKVRVQEAEYLLGATNLKIYEIAEKTGYKSQHYFCVAFKKYYNIAPTEYRSERRKKGGKRNGITGS